MEEEFLPSTWEDTHYLLENFNRAMLDEFSAHRMNYQDYENVAPNLYAEDLEDGVYRLKIESWVEPWEEQNRKIEVDLGTVKLPRTADISKYVIGDPF